LIPRPTRGTAVPAGGDAPVPLSPRAAVESAWTSSARNTAAPVAKPARLATAVFWSRGLRSASPSVPPLRPPAAGSASTWRAIPATVAPVAEPARLGRTACSGSVARRARAAAVARVWTFPPTRATVARATASAVRARVAAMPSAVSMARSAAACRMWCGIAATPRVRSVLTAKRVAPTCAGTGPSWASACATDGKGVSPRALPAHRRSPARAASHGLPPAPR
jgi:hypothetical protein